MNESFENFDEVRIKGEELYKTLEPVQCPYFKEKVYFNAQGLEHLKFKQRNGARNRQDQYMRFKMLRFAPEVLRLSQTVQGIFHTKHLERVRINSRTDTIMKEVSYYEFVAVVEKVRVKVIVKQIENRQLLFWSIIPFWGINKDTKQRKLYVGDPEND